MFFLVVIAACLSFSFLPQKVNSAGTINIKIRQLILRKTPAECCKSEVECVLLGLPRQPDRTSYDHCQLNFQLCISVAESRASECLILSQRFSLDVLMSKPLNWEDRTFSAVELPFRSFNFTSAAMDSPNISITLEVWNRANDKLLLYSRKYTRISPFDSTPNTLSTTSSQNSLIYQLSANCHVGYVGQGCALVCEHPGPSDHYHCHFHNGMVCEEGWTGPRCSQPICTLPCLNAATCASPDQCRCGKGWRGKQCEECIPKQGCRNGYCLSEPGKCICKPNWTGADCELRIDKCLEKPCKNGGSCTTNGFHGEAFQCSCKEGFAGEDCSKLVSPCSNSPCGLHGDCIPTGFLPTDIYCRCHPGFWGSNCSNDRRLIKSFPLTISTIPSPRNKSAEVVVRADNISSSSSEDTKQIWVVNTLVAVCAVLLLMILIALCAPMFASRWRRYGCNCLHLKSEGEQNKKRTPRLYCLSNDIKNQARQRGFTKDEEELASIRSNLIKSRSIIMEEVGNERLHGVGACKSGRVMLDVPTSSAFSPRNQWRSAISLTHISEQNEEEAAPELEFRHNLTTDTCRSSPYFRNNACFPQQARRLTPLSTLLLLKSPPPPYSECNQQENNDDSEEASISADLQARTLKSPQPIDKSQTEPEEKEPQKRILTSILPEDSRPVVVQSSKIIDLDQRTGAIPSIPNTHSTLPSFAPSTTNNLRQFSTYDSLV